MATVGRKPRPGGIAEGEVRIGALTEACENLMAATDDGSDLQFTELCKAFSDCSRTFDEAAWACARGEIEEMRRLAVEANSLKERYHALSLAYQARHATAH